MQQQEQPKTWTEATLDRFGWAHFKERKVSNEPPNDCDCDFCGSPAVFKTSKAKVAWCRECDPEVKENYRLNEEDIRFI